jgi:hypothetical protein
MSASLSLKYLFGYPEHLVGQVRELLATAAWARCC